MARDSKYRQKLRKRKRLANQMGSKGWTVDGKGKSVPKPLFILEAI